MWMFYNGGMWPSVNGGAKLVSLTALSLMLGGCGLYFHDAGFNEKATTALEKADALDLTSMITAARINRKSLSEKQIELLQRNANLQADIRLATAVTSDYPLAVSVWNSEDFADALAALGAADNQTLVALDELYDEYADWEFQLNSSAERVKVFLGILPTPCLPSFDIQDVAKVDQAVADHERGVFKIVYNDYESACDDAKSAVSAVVDPLPSGRIKEAWKDWKTAE